MSRVGKLPVKIPAGVDVNITETAGEIKLKVKGPKGELQNSFSPVVKFKKEADELILERTNEEKKTVSLHGTYRALISNMVKGVSVGFEKKLTWTGVGYRMQAKGKGLGIQMGYSHDVDFPAIDGITFKVEGDVLTIAGIDKQLVGQVAANIREIRGPEPYKGKGIRYAEEHIIRKAGKAAK